MIYGNLFAVMNGRLARDYINPNDLAPMHDQLHVCESLFGDWNARVCLLMQDAADVESLREFHRKTGRPLLSHSPSAITNKRLVRWLVKHKEFSQVDIDGSHSEDCGVYYANAVWFLKKIGGMSGALRQRRRAIQESQKVLEVTFTQLSNLELIVAFGRTAYEALQTQFRLDTSWEKAREQSGLMRHGRFLIGVTNHPMARGVPEAWMEERFDNFLNQWRNSVKVS